MNVSAPFIARPVATTLLSIAMLLAGLLGYMQLPVSALPEVDFPTIEVTTQLPGASPETAAVQITASLERQLGQIAGLTTMISSSGPGVSRITLQFDLGRNIDDAAQDVQAAINASRGTLPQNLPYPPVYSKVNPADPPILTLALTSETLPIHRLSDVADTLLAQRLSQVSGVGRVSVQGNMRPAVRIQADPQRLAAYGLSMEDIRSAVVSANQAGPKGSLDGPRQASTVMANDQITAPADFARVVIAWRNGAPVRLSDVANVVDGLENTLNAAWLNGSRAVLLDVQRQPGANIVATVERLQDQLQGLQNALPPGVRLTIVADRTETIRASVHEVQFTLILSVVLVVLVIYLFLHSARATLVPAVALPLSIIGTFGVMWVCGFSMDNLSLMALTIATGFIVDDAIVMIENIVRLIEKGEKPLAAAFKGAAQIGFTVVSLTVSLIAVFIPLLFMTGVVGRLFREFALTLTISVLVSMVVSLTLTPMMTGLLMRPAAEMKPGLLPRIAERGFDWLRDRYVSTLDVALRHQWLMLLVTFITIGATVWLYVVVPKGFLPQQDTGLLTVITEVPQDASFTRLAERQQEVARVVAEDPDVARVTAVAGAGGINAAQNLGSLTAVLRPRADRVANAQTIAERLQARLAAIPDVSVQIQSVPDIRIGARASGTAFQYTLSDSDTARLAEWVPRLVSRLHDAPELRNVASDLRDGGLRLSVNVDRDLAARLGVTIQAVDDVLYDSFGQRQISTIYGQANQYRVVLEVDPAMRDDPALIGLLRIPGAVSNTGGGTGATQVTSGATVAATSASTSGNYQVPLSGIAAITRQAGPLTITRQDQFPAVTIGFDLAPGVSLGHAVQAIEGAQRALGMPDTMQGEFSGDAAEFASSLASEPYLILAAVVVIYLVLGMLYESAIHPITILSTLPSAGIGALLALWFMGLDLSVVGLIGIVLLMGIVKKNAIMMIDFALEAQRDEGMTSFEAIREACVLRFRPIMMTTMAALLGAVPLVLGDGPGSELRLPLGVSVIGGLLLSQVITLYTTPVIYLALERLRPSRAPEPIPRSSLGEG
ncbi:acriflavine resistance protein B [Rhodovarius crocodyli]|uniref:Acriflavine resistance protein B n=1 Tax=Rhodovarius crocodyli TaxID=1979269 RepID=A0A437MJI7_9PROT|nr:efflux RND transporter permease subunit [Rhodovarius crocodyli]RVT97755.1 acriflavine resistance protein B [Rhodovarius crocodyli]